MRYYADAKGNLHKAIDGRPDVSPTIEKPVDQTTMFFRGGRLFLKSQKVQQPGKRGGKYWMDKQGNIRYDQKPTGLGKLYYIQNNIGSAKYVVNYHDGVDRHKDGSPFWGARIFHNKRKMDEYIKEIKNDGYKYGSGLSKSLSLPYTGSEILAGLEKKIAEYEKEIEIAKKLDDSHGWEDGQLKRLKGIKARIEKDEEFELTPDEMSDYGLIKGVLVKSLEIEFKGKEIKAGIDRKITDIRKKAKIQKMIKDGKSPIAYDSERIKRLETVKARIEDDKEYQLNPYEMEDYNLIKSLSPELQKSIEFEIVGQKIKDALLVKVGAAKARLEALIKMKIENANKKGSADLINLPDSATVLQDSTGAEVKTVYDPNNDWDVKNMKRRINELETLIRNIDVKKKFKLSSYELIEYGL